jgi:nicotinamidase-related amidase
MPGDAVEINGVIRSGIIYVPLREIATTFNADLRWPGDVDSVVLKAAEDRRFCVSYDQPAADAEGDSDIPARLIDGQTEVPLTEVIDALELSAQADDQEQDIILTRGRAKALLHLTSEPVRLHPHKIALPAYRFKPPAGEHEEAITIDPQKTAVVVIDFWGRGLKPDGAYDNTASLIELARRNGMRVIHMPHEGAVTREGVNPRILPIPEDEPVLMDEKLEDYLAANHLDVDTLLYAGFSAAECVLYTRPNSINNVARRSNRFRIVLIKDATFSPYWTYQFTINGIETKYATSTLHDLAAALGDPARTAPPPVNIPIPSADYPVDEEFGTSLEPARTALVLINTWDGDDDPQWSARLRRNDVENVVPLLNFARAQGINVIHVPNGRRIAPEIERRDDEPVVGSMDELRAYLKERGIAKVLYAGNITNTTPMFAALDVWSFTNDLGVPIQSRFLADCIAVYETPDSLKNGEQFKKVFLERATFAMGENHEVTSLAIMQRNAAGNTAEHRTTAAEAQ